MSRYRTAEDFSNRQCSYCHPHAKGFDRIRSRFYLFHCPYWTIRELGMSGAELSQMLGMGQSSVSRAVGRGEKLVNGMKLTPLES